ncbi:MAG TPA: DUF177 domain-containing protein [Pyrinomonadaceae bacterium]|jgi:uncharacterized protein|nr:DUF177 domain-containing protein [Pyrinomonadaceae bacterium]
MRVELVNLEKGKGDFTNVYQPDDLDLGDERARLCGTTSVFGQIRQAGIEVIVTGHVDGSVQVECDRCLSQIELPVSGDFSLEYITDSDYEAFKSAELTEDVMSIGVFDGESIDVDEIVKEQILLAVPIRSLCKPDCKGFCPTCGVEKNVVECGCQASDIDPRWEALKGLMNGKS